MIDITVYKTQLEEDLLVITKELTSLGIHNPQVKEDWIAVQGNEEIETDENLVADRAEDFEERVATLSALETQYNDILRALAKIENGTYGVCEISDEKIEEARLNANPSARTCMAHMDDEQDLI